MNGPLDFSDPEYAAAQVKYGDATLGYAMFAAQGLERLRTSENQTHRNAYRAITAVVATIVALIVLFVVVVFIVSLIINSWRLFVGGCRYRETASSRVSEGDQSGADSQG